MKILLRGANWIGDAVMTIPAMRELRRSLPDAELTLYTRPWAEGLFRDADFIDKIVKIESSGSRFSRVLLDAKRIRAESYDVAILFPNSFESAAVVRFAGIPRRFGYSRDARGILLTDPIKPPKWQDERHQLYYYLNIIAEFERRFLHSQTGTEITPVFDLPISQDRRATAREYLQEAGCDISKPTIAFGPGSTNSMAKRWGEQNFAELSSRLQTDSGANILLLGSREELDVSGRVSSLSSADIIDLTGKTDLAEVTAILSEIELFISNDMGLAHIAAAVGTNTLVIFGPTNHITTRPFGPNAEVIRHDVECAPCMLRECPIDHRCMTRVSVDSVYEASLRRLSSRR